MWGEVEFQLKKTYLERNVVFLRNGVLECINVRGR